jgi:hypothetical protein
VLSGAIPLAVSNTGATSHALLPSAPLIPTGEWSQAVFHLPNGAMAAATAINKLHLNVHESARSVNIVPALVENSLLSPNKFVEAGYTVIYDAEEVNFYNTRTTKIVVSEAAIFKGWRCPRAKLWRVPITEVVTNKNTDTLLLDIHTDMLASMPCIRSRRQQSCAITSNVWVAIPARNTYTMCMNYPASNHQSNISTAQRVSQQNHHG